MAMEALRTSGLPQVNAELLQRWDESMINPAARKDFTKLLKKIPLFAEAPDAFRASLPDVVVPAEYAKEQVVFKQGQKQDWCAIVLSGRLERRLLLASATADKTIGQTGPGGVVGDMGLLGLAELRTVSVVVHEPATLLLLSKGAFEELVRQTGGFAAYPLLEAAQGMQNLTSDKDGFCTLKCFSKLERDFVLALCNELEPRLLYPGSIMMKEAEVGYEMFIVHAGRVNIEKNGRVIAELNGGVVLGELAVLGSDKRRTATVRCTDICLVYVLNGEVVQLMLDKFPTTKMIYDHEYIARLLKFELEKVGDEISQLDNFYGNAHPMGSKQVRTEILGLDDPDKSRQEAKKKEPPQLSLHNLDQPLT